MSKRTAAKALAEDFGIAVVSYKTEQGLTAAIRDTLRAMGCWCERLNSGRRGNVQFGLGKGAADLIGLCRGKAFAIECKRTHANGCNCRSCETQRTWARDWARNGGLYILARTVDDAVTIVRRLVA